MSSFCPSRSVLTAFLPSKTAPILSGKVVGSTSDNRFYHLELAIMKKKNIARRALDKMGFGKRTNTEASTTNFKTGAETLQKSATYQPPHATTNLDRKMKRRHVSAFARQCAEYIQQMLAKRREAKAAKLRSSH